MAAHEARAAARRSAPRLTTAAAGGAPGGYRHLRRAARPMRRGTPRCDLVASRRPRWRVRPWPHLPRRSRGASSRAQIGAAAHHGRRRGRSRRLSASASRGTPDAPRHAPLRPHGEPRAASARRAVAASATPRLRRERPRGNRRHCSPRPPLRAPRGSIRIWSTRWQDGGLRKRRREDEIREEGERRLRPRDPGKRGKHQ
jgi:hypothetical protein